MEMHDATLELAANADIVFGVAAVADYRVANPAAGKLRRDGNSLNLELVPNPDILAAVAKSASKAVVVGFAAEPSSDTAIAQEKIRTKGLFAIAANDISNAETGFGSDRNRLQLIFADGKSVDSGVRSKFQCAVWLLTEIGNRLRTKSD